MKDFKSRKQTLAEICIDDAMFNRPYAEISWHGKGSEFAGWGLTRGGSRFITYQRLWLYVVELDILLAAVHMDMHTTNSVPQFEVTHSGIGFDTILPSSRSLQQKDFLNHRG